MSAGTEEMLATLRLEANKSRQPRRHEKAGNDAEMEAGTDRAVFKRVHFTDSQSVSTKKKPAEDGSSGVLFSGFQKSLLNPNAGSNISYSNLLNSPNQEI